MGDPAGAQPGHGARGARHPVSSRPGPVYQFVGSFDTVFEADSVRVVKTQSGSSCQRVCGALGAQRSGRVPGLDLIWNRRHLSGCCRLMSTIQPRPPSPGLSLEVPAVTDEVPLRTGPTERVDVLGGLIMSTAAPPIRATPTEGDGHLQVRAPIEETSQR